MNILVLKKIKFSSILIFSFCIYNNIFSVPIADTLKETNIEQQLKSLNKKSEILINTSSNQAEKNLKKTFEIINKSVDNKEIGKANYLYGLFLFHRNENHKAQEFFLKAKKLFEKTNDTLNLINTLDFLSKSYIRNGLLKEGFDLKIKSLEINTKLNPEYGRMNLYYALGEYYYSGIKDHTKGIEYYQKAISEPYVDNTILDKISIKFAEHEIYKKDIDSAETILKLSLSKKSLENNFRLQSKIYFLLGNIHLQRRENELALEKYRASLQMSNELGQNSSPILLKLAEVYLGLKDTIHAENYLQIAFDLATHDSLYYTSAKIVENLIRLTKKRKEKAYNLQEKLIELKDLDYKKREEKYKWMLQAQERLGNKVNKVVTFLKESELQEEKINHQIFINRALISLLIFSSILLLLAMMLIARSWKKDRLTVIEQDKTNEYLENLEANNVELKRKVKKIKEIETKFIKEQAFLNGLLDAIPDLIFYKDNNSNYLGCNRSYADFYNINKKNINGKTDYELFSNEYADYFRETDRQVLENGKTLRRDNIEYTIEDEKRILDTYKTPIYSPGGEALGVMGISRDVTDIKKAKEEIIKLSQAVEQNPVAIIITDTKGVVEYANPIYSKLTGKNLSEIIRSKLDIFEDESGNQELMKEIIRSLHSGMHWRGEFENKKKNKERYWEINTFTPIYNKNGNIDHFLVIKEDITERKDREKELLRTKQEALEASKAKSSFLANMSHEIRTPMNGIISTIDFLKQSNLDKEQSYYLNIIDSSADNLMTIINDILDLSKIEAGKLHLENTVFSPIKTMKDVIGILSIKAKSKNIPILKNFDKNIPENVIGDPTRLRQILLNLTDNAIKFTPKGFVLLSCKLKKETEQFVELQFKVKDTGIGVASADQKKLFKSFTQVDESTTRKYGGTGLGLTISKLLVGLMNGKIDFTSKTGEGSEFFFTASFKTLDEKALKALQENKEKENPEAPTPQLNILLAEDNLINQKVAQVALKRLNHLTDIAKNGKIAVEMFKQKKYDIVLMDIQMPEMDGYEAARKIRQLESNDKKLGTTYIIAVTANAIKGDKEKCLAAGMNDYISKPYKVSELKKVINNRKK